MTGAVAQDHPAVRVAVFDFELIDTSLDGAMTGPKREEAARVDALGAQLRTGLAARAGLSVLDIAPVADAAAQQNMQNCGGCDLKFSRKLGADWSITGTVQKVSNLILNINVYIRNTRNGKLAHAYSVDIRGNNDESWTRGMSWLLRNRIRLPD